MNKNFRACLFLTPLAVAGWFAALPAQADISFSTEVQMTNVRWTPSGGAFDWTSQWQAAATASVFDSQNGFTNAYQSQTGQPAAVAASATTSLAVAGSQATIDASGNNLFLESFLAETNPAGVTMSAFSAVTASRAFEIVGGSGAVPVTFSFDYAGWYLGTDDAVSAGAGAEYLASLRISDGVNEWDLTANDILGASASAQFGGTLSQSFSLQYDTAYSITLVKDYEPPPYPPYVPPIPEPGSPALLAVGIILGVGWQVLKARISPQDRADAGRRAGALNQSGPNQSEVSG